MNKLKRIQRLVKECLLADAEVLEPDHATVVYNQILAAFKAHIEGFKPDYPKASMLRVYCLKADKAGNPLTEAQFYVNYGVDTLRKALMESLE